MIDQAVDCATKIVDPGFVVNGVKQIGPWRMDDKSRKMLSVWVANALVKKLGCPNKRRLFLDYIKSGVGYMGKGLYDFGNWVGCQVYGVACYIV